MDTYELQYNLASTAGPLVAVTLIGGSGQASVLEFGVSASAATVAGEVVFGRPAAAGTGSAGTALQPLDPSDPAPGTAMLAGAHATTQPTAPSVPFRRWPFAATAGMGVIWGWDPGELILPAAGQLVLWIASGTLGLRGYAKVAEGG